MKDQGMPLGDFHFCFPFEPCSQVLKARMAALDAVTGAQMTIDRIDRRGVLCVAVRGVKVRLHLSEFDSIVTPSDLLRTIHHDRQFD